MQIRLHSARRTAVALAALAVILATTGCRSARYSIGDALSPDWLKSSDTKQKYTLYTNNAQNYYDLGSRALAAGDGRKALRNFGQAEAQFKKAMEFEGYSFKAYLGAAYAMMNQASRIKLLESIEYLGIADDLRSGDWRVKHGYARAYQMLAKIDGDEINQLEDAKMDARPDRAMQLDGRIGELQHRRRGYLAKTLTYTDEMMEAAPEQHQGYLLRGTTNAELGDYPTAISNLQKFLELAEQSRAVYEKWRKDGRPQGATGDESDLDRLIRRNLERDAEARSLLGTVYYTQGEYGRAVSILSSIYEINPDAPARYRPEIAQSLAKLGRYREAIAQMDVFIRALGRSGHDYDEIVRRAMAMKDRYLQQMAAIETGAKPTSAKSP